MKIGKWHVNWQGDMVSNGLPTINARNGHKVAEVASHNRAHASMLAAAPELYHQLRDARCPECGTLVAESSRNTCLWCFTTHAALRKTDA